MYWINCLAKSIKKKQLRSRSSFWWSIRMWRIDLKPRLTHYGRNVRSKILPMSCLNKEYRYWKFRLTRIKSTNSVDIAKQIVHRSFNLSLSLKNKLIDLLNNTQTINKPTLWLKNWKCWPVQISRVTKNISRSLKFWRICNSKMNWKPWKLKRRWRILKQRKKRF